ncbi:sensor histidine kinase [Alteromonas sp. CYL-A6]|uniref:sensor histidine kinase n=1 Tax=Alteromonas nitratireducens TaxID=3390813 RepID=UPI0034A9594E
MMFRDSIRRKIRWLIISFTVFVSLFFISLLILYAWLIEDNIFNQLVAQEARYIEQQFTSTGQVVSPRIPFMTLHPGWEALPQRIQQLHSQSPQRIEFPLDDGGTVHLREVALGNKLWLLSANVSSYEISKIYLPKLIPWILLVLGVMVVCAVILARYLAHLVVNPLQHIASGVSNQTEGTRLTFEQHFANDEIGYLAHTISDSFNRLHAALARETDFSRDISHELRTPVAVLKLVASRLRSDTSLDADSVSRVKTAVNDIEQSLNVLLALSREESVDTETLSLRQEIEHCVVNHFSFCSTENAELTITVPPTCRTTCNKNLLHILINNLLDNVVNHASTVSLTIEMKGQQLIFKNPVDVLPDGDILAPQVKANTSQGLGQGLHLVKRICRQCGWTVAAEIKDTLFILIITLK